MANIPKSDYLSTSNLSQVFNNTTATSNIIRYKSENGLTQIDVIVKDGNVWLTIEQMSQILGLDRMVISSHINKIFKEGELDINLVCLNFAQCDVYDSNSICQIKSNNLFYNLDVYMSVEKREHCKYDVHFHQWATTVMRNDMRKEYVYNQQQLGRFDNRRREFSLKFYKIPNNEIWYTSTDRQIIIPNEVNNFSKDFIVSNTYKNFGVIKFKNSVKAIVDGAFSNNVRLASIVIPDKVTNLDQKAFTECPNLKTMFISDSKRLLRCRLKTLCDQGVEIKKYDFGRYGEFSPKVAPKVNPLIIFCIICAVVLLFIVYLKIMNNNRIPESNPPTEKVEISKDVNEISNNGMQNEETSAYNDVAESRNSSINYNEPAEVATWQEAVKCLSNRIKVVGIWHSNFVYSRSVAIYKKIGRFYITSCKQQNPPFEEDDGWEVKKLSNACYYENDETGDMPGKYIISNGDLYAYTYNPEVDEWVLMDTYYLVFTP